MTLLEQLQALAPLAEAATPGKWVSTWETDETDPEYGEWDEVVIKAIGLQSDATPIDKLVVGMIYYDGDHAACTRENAAFIAASRNLLTPENVARLIAALAPAPAVTGLASANCEHKAKLFELIDLIEEAHREALVSDSPVAANWLMSDAIEGHLPAIQKLAVVLADKASTAPAVTGWVSVDERLPELGQDVLLKKTKGRTPRIGFLSTSKVKDGYVWDCGLQFISAAEITHWHPLPTLPATMEGASHV